MSNKINLSDTAANAMASALGPLLNSGTIKFYDGTQPANANTAITTQTLLATVTFGSTAFGAAAAGVITANAITPGTAVASSTCTWARMLETGGSVVVDDVAVATSGGGINLNTTTIASGAAVSMTSLTLTVTE